MLNLIDSIKHDMAQAEKNTADRAYHCLRIEVAALQLLKLLNDEHPLTYQQHLVVFLEDAFAAVARHNGD